MKRLMVRTALVVFLLSTKSHAQSGTGVPQADAGQSSQVSCVILKRMGRVDRTKSRLYSLGISGKHFRYVEGKLPEGFSLHGKMTDHDVRNLQAKGAQVLVLDPHYSSEDLKEAKANCPGQTGKTLDQAATKAPPAPAPGAVASNSATSPMAPAPVVLTPAASAPKSPVPETRALKTGDSATSLGTAELTAGTPASAPKQPKPKTLTPKANDLARSAGTAEAALVDVSSTPAGADVYIDERFFGRTPATTIILMPGNYKIAVKKDGFVVWKKKFKLPSGRTNVDAALVAKAK